MAGNALAIVPREPIYAVSAFDPQAHAAYLEAKRDLIKSMCIPEQFRRDEVLFETFLELGKLRGLNPILKQLYCIPRGGRPSIEVGIDGLRLIAARTGHYAGGDPYVWVSDEGAKHPSTASCTVYRFVYGEARAFTALVRWEEFVNQKNGLPQNNWATMPFHMLGKVAEAHALRRAFPEETSGLYIGEEMEQADNGGAALLPCGLPPQNFASLQRIAAEHGLTLDAAMHKGEILGALRNAGGKAGDKTWTGILGAIRALPTAKPAKARVVPPPVETPPVVDADGVVIAGPPVVVGAQQPLDADEAALWEQTDRAMAAKQQTQA